MVFNAISQISKKTWKRPDNDRLIAHLSFNGDISEEDDLKIIDGLESYGFICLETYEDGSNSYFISSLKSIPSHHDCLQTGSFCIEENAQSNPLESCPTAADAPQSRGHIYANIFDFKKYMHNDVLS